jgi:hypothetical protein
MLRRVISLSLIMAIVQTGCASVHRHGHGGKLVAAIDSDRTGRRMTYTAEYDADVALHRWGDAGSRRDRALRATVVDVVPVKRGETVGFEWRPPEQYIAYAGDRRIELQPGRYCWHVTVDTERSTGKHFWREAGEVGEATAQTVLIGVAIGVGVVAAVGLIFISHADLDGD